MHSTKTSCPVCLKDIDQESIVPSDAIEDSIKSLLTVNTHQWEPGKIICLICLGRFNSLRDELGTAFPHFAQQEKKILPTPMRLEAPSEYRGRGVTIAFLDAGFYAHPDLIQPRNRILKYVNIVDRTRPTDLRTPKVSSWHGMMTSVVAAGNGYLSGGLYRGIASESDIVLVKVGRSSRIRHLDISAGLRWVIRNRDHFNI